MRVLKNFAVALTMVLFAMSPEVRTWTFGDNRFHLHWGLKDAVAGVLLLVLAGSILTAMYQSTLRFGLRRCRRFLKWSFLVLTVFLVSDYWVAPLLMRVFRAPLGWGWLVFWGPVSVAYVVLAVLMARKIDRLARIASRLFLIFSPIVPIVVVQLFSYHTWEDGSSKVSRSLSELARPHWATSTNGIVLLVLFDEWSVQRSLADYRADGAYTSGPAGPTRDLFIPDLANLNAFSKEALVFRNARAPGGCTEISIPSMIYERFGTLHIAERDLFWNMAEGEVPSSKLPTIFDAARERGYVTALIGCYLQYNVLAPGRFDAYRCCPYTQKGDGLLSRIFWWIVRSGACVHHPAISVWAKCLQGMYLHKDLITMNDRAMEWTASTGPGTLLFFHLAVTHAPIVVRADGGYRPLLSRARWCGTERDYSGALCVLDRVVSSLVAALKRTGQYDAATIILTSDHSWRTDPARPADSEDWVRHVPLVIKCPRQERGQVEDARVETIRLGRVLRLAFEGRAEPEAVLEAMGIGEDKENLNRR